MSFPRKREPSHINNLDTRFRGYDGFLEVPLRHFTSNQFWRCFYALPIDIQILARRNYILLKQDPTHPSLRFKPVHAGRFRSVRVGIHYRALGVPVAEGVQWFWIGPHSGYDKFFG